MHHSIILQDDSECQEIVLDDEDETLREPESSTKQPLQQGGKKPTKRQRLESIENDLLKKAIKCIDETTTGSEKMDSVELFGQYVASELRALNNHSQRWVKLQVQNILFNAAQSETGVSFPQPSMDPFSQPFSSPRQFYSSTCTPNLARTPSISPTPEAQMHSNII